jgi:hypothetical protein
MLVEKIPRTISGIKKSSGFKGIGSLQRPNMRDFALLNASIWKVNYCGLKLFNLLCFIHQQFGHSRDFSNCAEEVDSKDDDDVTGISSR